MFDMFLKGEEGGKGCLFLIWSALFFFIFIFLIPPLLPSLLREKQNELKANKNRKNQRGFSKKWNIEFVIFFFSGVRGN